jgi:hypothetical protein
VPESFAPNLGLPYGYDTGQNGWGAPMSNALKKLDALVNVSVISILTSPPSSPTNGDRHLIGVDATGAWSAKDNQIAVRVAGTWEYYAPPLVRTVFVQSLGYFLRWTGTEWTDTEVPEHATEHLPNGSDALPWGTIHGFGVLSARPAASSTLDGYTYLATDVHGGTPYRCSYVASAWTWVQSGRGVTENGSGTRPVRPTFDSNHRVAWFFDEASGDFLERRGLESSMDFVPSLALVQRSLPGLFGDSARFTWNQAASVAGAYAPPGNAVTVELWFRPLDFSASNCHLIQRARVASFSGFGNEIAIGLYYSSSGGLSVYIGDSTTIYGASDAYNSLQRGNWHHIAATFDGTTLKLYVNGGLVGSVAAATTIDYGTGGLWRIFGYGTFTGFGAGGQIADVIVSNVARNAAYMRDAWSKGQPNFSQ